MADFLEERISDLIRYGSNWQDDFAVNIVKTSGGQEYRSLIHPYPVRKFDISYMLDSARLWSELVNVYMRAHGMYAGFRARCFDEWSSNGPTGTPTAFDQPLLLVSPGIYQLVKQYGTDKVAGASGYAYRQIKKPVAGTVLVGIGATAIRNADWSVALTTGRIAFAANQSKAISGITQAAQAVVTVGSGHGLVAGQSVQIDATVNGMTQIRSLRSLIVATDTATITVAINSSAFSSYSSGGAVNTGLQAGETVSAGFQFDFPVRFATTLPVGQDYPGWRPVEGVSLMELLNP